ncbi:MAG: nicotinate-nucleotide adenylyltransferase [Gammaproteobacteria bacterium]|nr:nicotinate-nucleotide adenylyltransferase [Gammaproteobacteria bacterium]
MIGILGGTFDPVHIAHLRCALEVRQALRLAEVRFLPCRQPPHRPAPTAGPAQRLAMLRLALEGQAGFSIDERELRRAGPSYMVDTLTSLREELPGQSLCLILGVDAFIQLHTWHRWERLIELAHLAVMTRPGPEAEPGDAVAALLRQHRVEDPRMLHDTPAGHIVFCPVTRLEISATRIRALLAQDGDAHYLTPDGVLDYIRQTGLYRAAHIMEAGQ